MTSLNIALDFDGTFTADPEFYASCIRTARSIGHQVFCVTCRRDTEENRELLRETFERYDLQITTLFTGLRSKMQFCKEAGIRIDNWWDDDPETLVRGH